MVLQLETEPLIQHITCKKLLALQVKWQSTKLSAIISECAASCAEGHLIETSINVAGLAVRSTVKKGPCCSIWCQKAKICTQAIHPVGCFFWQKCMFLK